MKSPLIRHVFKTNKKLNTYVMKRLLLFIAMSVAATTVYSQKSIDALFDKYAGKDGFTTVTINGNLLKLFNCLDDEHDKNSMTANLTEIRILAQDDNNIKVDNFYDQVIRGINVGDYEEFMRVKESDQDLGMLVRAEGRRFKEFLLVAGGEDNLVIQIKGNMTFEDAKKISSEVKKNHGVNIVADLK